jgi:hypothetical protein
MKSKSEKSKGLVHGPGPTATRPRRTAPFAYLKLVKKLTSKEIVITIGNRFKCTSCVAWLALAWLLVLLWLVDLDLVLDLEVEQELDLPTPTSNWLVSLAWPRANRPTKTRHQG